MQGITLQYIYRNLFKLSSRGRDSGSFLRVEEYWPWVGGIYKCLGANARGFIGVNPPGWPLISALIFTIWAALQCHSHVPVYLWTFTPLFLDVVVVSDLNKNFGGSTDLAKKWNRSADLHTPIHPPPEEIRARTRRGMIVLSRSRNIVNYCRK